jgi:hypothetical protein
MCSGVSEWDRQNLHCSSLVASIVIIFDQVKDSQAHINEVNALKRSLKIMHVDIMNDEEKRMYDELMTAVDNIVISLYRAIKTVDNSSKVC